MVVLPPATNGERMATQDPERLQLLRAVAGVIAEAAESRRILHTAEIAAQLAERYPSSGMTLRDIEDEAIRQIGLACGVAEIGNTDVIRPSAAPARRVRLSASLGAGASEGAIAQERSVRR